MTIANSPWTLLLFALASAPSGLAAVLTGGVRGGLPLTDVLDTAGQRPRSFVSDTKPYIVGPTIGVNLPLGLSANLDALYRRFTWESGSELISQFPAFSRARVDSWDFPLYLRWTIGRAAVRPFVEGGPAFRWWSGEGSDSNAVLHSYNIGAMFGGGLQFHLGPLKISPQLRYTRWGVRNFREAVRSLVETNPNQADLLIGITF